MRKRNIAVAAASAIVTTMVLASAAGNAWAYFTTNTNATGGHVLSLLPEETTVDEEFSFNDWTKRISVTNTDESGRPVYVRVKAFYGSQYDVRVEEEAGRAYWTLNEIDGYYYYNAILNAGETTAELPLYVDNVPELVTNPDDFNVVVIYEVTPVQYDAGGNPAEADWNLKLEVTKEGGNS